MTAKEKLRQTVEQLSEEEAQEALRYLDERGRPDALTEFLDKAPGDDKPLTPEEEEGMSEARAEIKRGQTVPLEQLRRDLG